MRLTSRASSSLAQGILTPLRWSFLFSASLSLVSLGLILRPELRFTVRASPSGICRRSFSPSGSKTTSHKSGSGQFNSTSVEFFICARLSHVSLGLILCIILMKTMCHSEGQNLCVIARNEVTK